MWVRLIKGCEVGGKKYPIGRVLNVIPEIARRLKEDSKAQEYIGSFPPKKMKTDFFKPK